MADPTQGGAGVVNYLICQHLLNRGFSVEAFFRVSETFFKQSPNIKYLKELEERGIKYRVIKERSLENKFLFGKKLFLALNQYQLCQEIISGLGEKINEFDACISFDSGWAIALAGVKLPIFRLLEDPIQGRMEFGQKYSLFNPISWKRWLQLQSLKSRSFYKWLKKEFGEKSPLFNLSPYDAQSYKKYGIDCRYVRLFTPEVKKVNLNTEPKDTLIGLHVGELDKTGSMNMVGYLTEELFPELSKLSFNIEIRFVGRASQQVINKLINNKSKNLELVFLGHLSSMESEFNKADFFFSPVRYPVGVRTRVVTAISYGMPVIADKEVSLGMPELKHGYDILYGSTPRGIIEILEKAHNNPAWLVEIGNNARKSWEKLYHPKTNIGKIISFLNI